ncbi:unnamed protein product, partial [Rotaria magnacalcarata]
SRDSPPIIKVESRLFGTLEKIELEFLRLSLPLACHDKFSSRQATLERRQIALNEYAEAHGD